jgi:hypothetical protein
MQTENKKSSRPVVIAIVVLVVLALGLVCWKVFMSENSIKKSQYQAVFLANGQVYFGKISNVSNSYVKLTDIYYLQVQQAVQPAQSSSSEQPKVSLAKLGNELHGPEDEMQINRDQVLFWENLKDDSKVVTAIKENQSK